MFRVTAHEHSAPPSARRERDRRAGFTLIELMIVVVIISILAALVVPSMFGSVDRANVAAAKAQINSFKTAILSYKMDFRKFPGSLNDLVNNGKRNYLDQDVVPKDPWGNDYQYKSPGGKGHEYEIVSYGADGQPGGSDFGADIESFNLQGKEN